MKIFCIFWVFCWSIIFFLFHFQQEYWILVGCVILFEFIDDLSWRFSSTWLWMFSGFCCLAVQAKDINQFISFSKATVFSAEFRHGCLRLVLVFSPLFFSLSITLDLNFRQMNQLIYYWSYFIHLWLYQLFLSFWQSQSFNSICLFSSL